MAVLNRRFRAQPERAASTASRLNEPPYSPAPPTTPIGLGTWPCCVCQAKRGSAFAVWDVGRRQCSVAQCCCSTCTTTGASTIHQYSLCRVCAEYTALGGPMLDLQTRTYKSDDSGGSVLQFIDTAAFFQHDSLITTSL